MITMYNNNASTHLVHFTVFHTSPIVITYFCTCILLKANNYYLFLSNSHSQNSALFIF